MIFPSKGRVSRLKNKKNKAESNRRKTTYLLMAINE
jgi:hypothetical protein